MTEFKGLKMLHPKNYTDVINIAKRYVGDGTREMLLYAQLRADGRLVATDSHQIIIVENAHGFKEEYLLNPKTGEFATGTYPDIDKHLPEPKEPTIVLTRKDVHMWFAAHFNMIQTCRAVGLSDHNQTVFRIDELTGHVEIKAGSVSLSFACDIFFTEHFTDRDGNRMEWVAYNAELMTNALEAMRNLKSGLVHISFYGNNRPIVLDNKEGAKIIVYPLKPDAVKMAD